MANIILLLMSLAFTTQDVNDSIKYEMLLKSMLNDSTSPNYVLVVVKNENTNESKEICIAYPIFEQALEIEYGNGEDETNSFSAKSRINDNDGIYFTFSKDKSLKYLGFNNYNLKEFTQSSTMYDFEAIIKEIKLKGEFIYNYQGEQQFQNYFVHVLLERGIMVQRGCFAGNSLTLKRFEM